MVKVVIDDAKGLVQSAGTGSTVNNTLNLGGRTTLNDMVWGSEVLTGAGALSTTVPVSLVDTTGGAAAITLGDGSYAGQVKFIVMVKDGGDATLTLNDPAGASNTYTFANVGETLLCVWVVDEDGTAVGWAEVSRGSGANAAASAVAGLPAASTV